MTIIRIMLIKFQKALNTNILFLLCTVVWGFDDAAVNALCNMKPVGLPDLVKKYAVLLSTDSELLPNKRRVSHSDVGVSIWQESPTDSWVGQMNHRRMLSFSRNFQVSVPMHNKFICVACNSSGVSHSGASRS